VKRPENLKEYAPSELGRVVGLDRIPEVKTLRRKLEELAKGPVEEYLLALARRRFLARDQALGWLYVDGHVRVYHGKEKIPATHVTRMRISMPAAQDIWIHDGDCNPVLAITLEAHPSLANVILPILEAAQELTGKRRLTMVFDRGGWSPTLFALLAEREVDFLTYRKGKYEAVPVDAFNLIPAPTGGPDWLLHDSEVELKSGMTVRQITRLKGTHQTPIITTRRDLPAEVLAARMFGRWSQENFFKYMRQEYDLDALAEYGAEEDDPLREIPNPEWNRANKALQAARAGLKEAQARTMDKDHADVTTASQRVDELLQKRNALKQRIQVADLPEPPVRLRAVKKRLLDGLKTVAYQIETDLTNAVAPYYRRAEDEGRTLITSALSSSGDLDVTKHELTVTLAPQSSPHRTAAIAELCRLLDGTETCFPGTSLRLRYRIAGSDRGKIAAGSSAM
jgi:hypothetical protein